VECEEPVTFRVTYESSRVMSDVKLDILRVHEFRWENFGTVRAGNYIFFYGTRQENHEFSAECLKQHRIDRYLREECLLVLGYHI